MFKFLRNRKGQGMVEYILIIAVVVGIILGAYKLFGTSVKEQFESAKDDVDNARIEP